MDKEKGKKAPSAAPPISDGSAGFSWFFQYEEALQLDSRLGEARKYLVSAWEEQKRREARVGPEREGGHSPLARRQ